MIDNNNLIEMNYLKSEYFDRSERLLARSLWCKVLKQDVERWNNDKYLNIFPKFGSIETRHLLQFNELCIEYIILFIK